MKRQTITLLLAAAILFGLASCSDEDKYKGIPIRNVKATSTVELSKRPNWKYYVGLSEYNYTVTGNVLTATPKSEDNKWTVGFHYWGYYAGYEKQPYGGAGYGAYSALGEAVLRTALLSPNYHVMENGESAEKVVDQFDQSTPEKMLDADALTSWHETIVSENVENAVLNHEHCLVQYTLVDFPEGMTPKLKNGTTEIKPYVADKITQVILVHPSNNTLEVTVEDKTYAVELGKALESLSSGSTKDVRDMYYTFEVKYNKDEPEDSKKLTIQNLKTKKWSEIAEK